MDKMTTKDEIEHGEPGKSGWDNFRLLHEEVVVRDSFKHQTHQNVADSFLPKMCVTILYVCLLCALSGCCARYAKPNLFNDGRKCFATTLCCEASKVACNDVVTNGVIHSRWIVESSLNNTIIDNLPTERALIFDVRDARKRVELNNAEKIQLRWCLADARIADYIPIKLGVCNLNNFDYVLGIGELCKCERCQEERSDFCALVGADYAFVQSVVDVYLSKDGDSDIKFADDKRQQKFLELVVPKIQLLSIAK